MHGLKSIQSFKMAVLLKLTRDYHNFSQKPKPGFFFVQTDKLILKFMERQQTRIVQGILKKKKEQNWRTVSDFKTHYKASGNEIT